MQTKRIYRALAPTLTLCSALGLSSCLAEDDSPPPEGANDEASSALFAQGGSAWSVRDIPVCFDTAGFPSENQWIREALTGDWSWQAFGNVNFTGWGTCSGTGQRIRIELTTSSLTAPETSPGLGQQPGGTSTLITLRVGNLHLLPRCTSNGLVGKECIQVVALHEFGHALGYDHEFVNGFGSPGSPPCPDGNVPNQGGNVYLTRYDPVSIMNYCNWPIYPERARPVWDGKILRPSERRHASIGGL